MHPVLKKPSQWNSALPLGFHGDAGPIAKHDSLFVLSFNGLMGEGATLRKRFIVTVIAKSKITVGTMDEIWKIFGWSMGCLLRGVTPSRDWAGRALEGSGKELAGGLRGAVVQARGDWEWYSDHLEMPRWDHKANNCWICGAGKMEGSNSWTRWQSDAGWRATRKTHESWLADRLAAGQLDPPAAFRFLEGFRLECVTPDILHVADQGVTSHLLGNIFFEIVAERGFGKPDIAGNLMALEQDMKKWYQKTQDRSQLRGQLKVERLKTSNEWPKLKAKAAATRHLAKYGLLLAERFNSGSEHDRRRAAAAKLMCRFYEIIEGEGSQLPASAIQELATIGRQFMGIYTALSKEAAQHRVRAWKMVPKFHIWQHLAEWVPAMWGNPRFFWTYADEDLIGSMIEIGKSCHPTTLPLTALYKWLVYLSEVE